jgi:hypothetical protein
MVRIEAQYQPDPATHAVYNEIFEIYKHIYKALAGAGVYKQITDFQQH